jgi:RNA polymerase sigma-70 factor (ECF subfamily)
MQYFLSLLSNRKTMPAGFNLNTVLHNLGNDDKKALEDLFNYYYPRLYQFSKSFLKLEEGIDDILQEVFVKIWRNRDQIRSSETFNQYIFTMTRNLLLNELRGRLNKQRVKDEIFKASVPEEYHSFAKIEYRELKEAVDQIVNDLPKKQREVFLLSRRDGLSHKEIAENLKITTKTVEYHISQSVSRIKNKLDQLGLISLLYFYLFI